MWLSFMHNFSAACYTIHNHFDGKLLAPLIPIYLRLVTAKRHIRIIQPMFPTYYTVLLSRWLLKALPALTQQVRKVTPFGIIQDWAYKTRQRACVATVKLL